MRHLTMDHWHDVGGQEGDNATGTRCEEATSLLSSNGAGGWSLFSVLGLVLGPRGPEIGTRNSAPGSRTSTSGAGIGRRAPGPVGRERDRDETSAHAGPRKVGALGISPTRSR